MAYSDTSLDASLDLSPKIESSIVTNLSVVGRGPIQPNLTLAK